MSFQDRHRPFVRKINNSIDRLNKLTHSGLLSSLVLKKQFILIKTQV